MTDHALSLGQTATALGISRSTFYRLDRDGWLRTWGLVELPRGPLVRRRYSAASVDRVIRGGGLLCLKVRPVPVSAAHRP